ncbi:SusC/RagA family TonB-linked outer membrane protein [Bergeyella porcorum]|uniref:SusC/RagA family TonB-linked outer membrane protein n=1 Tax=Bergeyella porcorum TaxID=1735111 RepID=UPI0035E6CECC
MKKLTTSVLAVVLTSSFAMMDAQVKKDTTTKTKDIEGVVVTALGIKKSEKALGYSATNVGGDALKTTPSQNLVNSLSGKVAGVQVVASGGAPGQASRMVIRGGAKSLTNSNEPLYVIDGIPVSNANDGNADTVAGMASPNRVADINPDDIESVTVLKGAAGAVLYGNRGSNGVVLITTKSGRSSGGKAVFEYSSQTSFDNALVLPDYQTKYAQGSNGNYVEGTSLSWGPEITGQTVMSAGAGARYGLGAQSITLRAYDPRKQYLRTGFTTTNNISAQQSIGKSNYFVSAGYSNQSSIIPNQGYKKFNFRFNGNTQFTDKFSAGVNASYNKSWGDVPFTGQDGNNPIFALFHVPVSWDLAGYGYERPNGRQINFRGGSFDNPYWSVYKNFANTNSDRFILGLNLNYKMTNWLNLSYRVGNDKLIDNRTLFRDMYSGGSPNGSLLYSDISRNEITSTFMANINTSLGDRFNLTANLGQDYNERRFRQSEISGSALVLPGIANTNNIAAFNPGYNYESRRTLFGVFADVSLSYNNYLFLNLVGRNEWSSTLPANNRSYFYPGANLSFVFTDAFGISKNVMNYGKIRLGASRTARDANPYLTIDTYRKAEYADGFTDGITFPFGALPGYTVANTINNANLKPEFTTEYEVGADLRFLNDRIGLDVSYFYNKNTDGIIPLDISPASGAVSSVINSGVTESRGIEAALRLTPIRTSDFRWDLNFNFSRIRSKVLETYEGVDKIYLGGFSGNPAIYAVKGERFGSIIGSGYVRNDQGQILVDDNGIPLYQDGVNLGHVEPDWTGGVSTSFSYKGIYLNAALDMRMGGYLYNGTEELLDYYGVSAKTANRGTSAVFNGINETTGQANTVANSQDFAWYYFSQNNEMYVYKNNWVKLRELALGYRFKPSGFPAIRQMELGLYGRNLFLWTKIPHIDPESSSFGTGNAQGVSRFAFPTTRSFGVNFKIQF